MNRFNNLISEPLKSRFDDKIHLTINRALNIDQKVLILLHKYYSFSKSAIDDTPFYVCIFDFTSDMDDVYFYYREKMHENWDLPFTEDPFYALF